MIKIVQLRVAFNLNSRSNCFFLRHSYFNLHWSIWR